VDEYSLFEMLRHMGLRRASAPVLSLLPLIEVAWADGVIQQGERDLILSIARYQFDFPDDGLDMLDAWLSYCPRQDYLERGRQVLRALADDTKVGVSIDSLEHILGFCDDVAKASGGLFGVGRVHHREREALAKIAATLRLKSSTSWEGSKADTSATSETSSSTSPVQPAEMAEPLQVNQGLVATLVSTVGHRKSYPCTVQGLKIGRSRINDIVLRSDGKISRNHCEIIVRNEVFYACDLGSANGTWVNGLRIRRRPLFGDELIRLGHTEFKFLVYRTIQDIPPDEVTKQFELPSISERQQRLEEVLFSDERVANDFGYTTELDDCEETEEAEIAQLSVKQLRAMAKGRGLKGYSKLKKSQLIELLLDI
jgi:pSer/pThr/pTyr-binding forkhead associated (FHA) protein